MQTKAQKKELVESLSEKIKASKALVFSDFKGLSVKDMTALRRELRTQGVDLKVMKKTLINIALQEAKIELNAKNLDGQVAVAVSSQDEIAAAKIIAKAAKTNENIKIVGGTLGFKAISSQEVMALAKLPSKEELLGKLVGTIQAPVSGLVNVMAGNLRGLVTALKAIGDQKQA